MDTATGAAQAGVAACEEQSTVRQEGWGSCCPWGPMWSSAQRVGPVVQSCAGSVLEELQPVGSPLGISSGRMAPHDSDPRHAGEGTETIHKGAEEMKCYGLTLFPVPCSPALLWE